MIIKWWKWKKKESHASPDDVDMRPENPLIVIQVVDGVHVDVAIEWPENCDIKPFAQLLGILNSGGLIGPQLAAAAIFASKVNEPEKAIAIHATMDAAMVMRKKGKIDKSEDKDKEKEKAGEKEKPLVPPTKFVYNQIKSHQH